MTDPPLDSDAREWAEVYGRLRRLGETEGAVTALEARKPSRRATRRLRRAVAARISIVHPNLLAAHVVGEGDARLFVAFDPFPHPTLSDVLAGGPLEPAECVRILEGAAAGVDALCQRGLVARDLAPDRVLVHPTHGGVLMDLGISPALLTELPLDLDPDVAFRSPEELRQQPVDIRSGVYSLGAIMFTALTGTRPSLPTWSDVDSSRRAQAAPRPNEWRSNLPPEIDAVVAHATAACPGRRYPNGDELSRAAAAALGADLSLESLPAERQKNEQPRRSPTMRSPVSPQPGGRPPTPSRAPRGHLAKFAPTRAGQAPNIARGPERRKRPPKARSSQRHDVPPTSTPSQGVSKGHADGSSTAGHADVPTSDRLGLRRPTRPPRNVVGAIAAAAARRGVALLVAVLHLVDAGLRWAFAQARSFASKAAPVMKAGARVAVRAVRRTAHSLRAVVYQACRLVLAASGRVGFTLGFARRGARRGVATFHRSTARVLAGSASVAAGAGRRSGELLERSANLRGWRPIVLRRMLESREPKVRKLARRQDVDRLIEATRYGLLGRRGPTVELAAPIRERAILALGALGPRAGTVAVAEALHDPSDHVRAAAVRVLQSRREAEPLVAALDWLPERGQSRQLVTRALLDLPIPGRATAVARVLIRRTGVEPLGEEDAALVIQQLASDERPDAANELVAEVVAALADDRDVVADRAEELLVSLAPTSTEAVIAELKAGAVPHRAASILGSVKDPRALSPLVEALEHCDRRVRMASALALGGLGNAAALAPLLRATRDSEHLVRVQAGHALDRVRTTAAGFDVSALVGPIIIDAVRRATDHGALRHSPRTRDGELPVLAAGESSRQVDPTKLRNLAAFVDHLGAAGLGRQSLSAGGERAAQVEESRKGG